MANLRANKITSTEVFETTGSVQFDGNGDSLSVGTSSDLTLGTGDFTIEAYIYPSNITDAYRAIISNSYTGTIGGWSIYQYGNDLEMYYDAGGGPTPNIFDAVDVLTAGTWQHISVTRASSAMRVFVNGVQVASVSNSTDFAGTTVLIGDNNAGDYFFNGFISNLRVLKGTALYTKNFTPPTRELTVIPNTVLLACTSTTNTAQEATGKTITVNGNAVANELTPGLLTDVVKSGGTSAITGSVEFGESDYLSLASSSDFNLGTGDFTIEFWIHPQKRFTSYPTIFQINATNAANVLVINFRNTSTLGLTNGNTVFATNTGFNLDSWFHVAIVRQSGVSKIYKNGISGGDTACTEDFSNSGSSNISIGWDSTIVSSAKYNGFISNLRVLKGTALYTGSFIPPSRELKKIPGTVLLCCKNSSDPTAEETGKTITANGDPAASNFTPSVGFDGSVTFDGVTKINTQNYFYIPTGNTENRGRGRGIFGGGESPISPNFSNSIDYIQIQTQGIASDFGDLTQAKRFAVACSSSTRGVFGGGNPDTNIIEYITISSTSNSTDFGDLILPTLRGASCSSSIRGLFGGGYAPGSPTVSNAIDYITIASTGNSNDFGDLTVSRFGPGAFASPTRGVFFGGSISPGLYTNTIEYVTIASIGNSLDFGDILVAAIREVCGCSNSIRGVYGSGYIASTPATLSNVLEYITIASTGNGIDFGDLTSGKVEVYGSTSNSIRGVWGGGQTPGLINSIDYVTIASTGNAQDFGDLTSARNGAGGCSDSHGGLG